MLSFFYSTPVVHDAKEQVFFKVEDLPEVQYVLKHYEMIREEVRDDVDGKYDAPYFNPSPPERSGGA